LLRREATPLSEHRDQLGRGARGGNRRFHPRIVHIVHRVIPRLGEEG
jgi:hypothetical protein